MEVSINRTYGRHSVDFLFYASLQVAAKAKRKGVENKLLSNSIKLLEKFKGDRTDITILDVGSNFGYLSLVWASSVAKNGRVVAFEPNSKVADSLIKSINRNGLQEKLQVENIALGRVEGEVTIYEFNTTSNVLLVEDLIETNRNKISMSTIDDYVKQNNFESIDLLKIDVDGIELDILKGASKIIKRDRPIIIVEVNADEEIFDFLKEHNYLLLDMQLEEPTKKIANLPPNVFGIPQEIGSYKLDG